MTSEPRPSGPADRRSILARAEQLVCGLLIGSMTLVVFVAVVFRYVLNSPIGGSDELARLLFTWLVFVGSGLAMSRGAHLGIDTLVQLLPPGGRSAVGAVADGLVLVILAVLVYYGTLLCAMTARVTTPALDVPVAAVYAAAPAGAVLMLVHHVARLIRRYAAVGGLANTGRRGGD